MTVEDLAEITIFGSMPGGIAVNNVWVVMCTPVEGDITNYNGLLPDINAAVLGAWVSRIIPLVTSQYTVYRTVAKVIESIVGSIVNGKLRIKRNYGEVNDVYLTTPQSGTRTTDPHTAHEALSVQLKTSRAGKSFRGSKRVGGIVKADTVNNYLQPTFRTEAQTQMDRFKDPLASLAVPLTQYRFGVFGQVAAYRASRLTKPFRSFFAELKSLPVNSPVGTQNTRKIYTGSANR
jgi:hypothetical protein